MSPTVIFSKSSMSGTCILISLVLVFGSIILSLVFNSKPKKAGYHRTIFFSILAGVIIFVLTMFNQLSTYIDLSRLQKKNIENDSAKIKSEVTLEVGQTYDTYHFFNDPDTLVTDFNFKTPVDGEWYELTDDHKAIKVIAVQDDAELEISNRYSSSDTKIITQTVSINFK